MAKTAHRYQLQAFAIQELNERESVSATMGQCMVMGMENGEPQFGLIDGSHGTQALVRPVTTIFHSHYHSYELSDTNDQSVIADDSSLHPLLSLLKNLHGQAFICPKYLMC